MLARRQPFAVVWVIASHDHDNEPEADDRAAHIWLKRVRKDLNRYVKGYSYVATNKKMRDILSKRLAKVGSKLFAFPLHISDDMDEAVQVAQNWMSEVIRENGEE